MKVMKKLTALVLAGACVLSSVQTSNAVNQKNKDSEGTPKYIFYFIGDGLGTAQRQISEYYLKEISNDPSAKLTMNTMPQSAINTTHSMDTLITDSAAAGTALATGYKTNNGMISVNQKGESLKTLMEAAEEKGLATGIATTTRVTHATPAVFVSHNESRGNENNIAFDMVDSGIDYLVGGGLRHFLPGGWQDSSKDAFGKTIKSKREDEMNIFDMFQAKGYRVQYGSKGALSFSNELFTDNRPYVNLFTYSHLPYSVDAQSNTTYDVPTLAEMTEKGIELLQKDEDGFFFMIEGGRIDHACHPNDAKAAIMDTLAFDEAVEEALEFYKKHEKETLILVVGDHETGGLGLGVNTNYFMNLSVLKDVNTSIEIFEGSYDGNRKAFYSLIEGTFGLKDLSKEEKSLIEKGMDYSDAKEYTSGNKYKYDEVAMAVTHILSERAGLYWTSYAHTATQIPLSAIGVGAQNFNGYLDNVDIARKTAELVGLELD